MATFNGKVGLVQRVLPNYRAPFFNALGEVCRGGLSLFAGNPRPDENISTVSKLDQASLTVGKNIHLFKASLYLCVQIGLLDWLKNWDPDVLIVEANPRYLRTSAAVRWMRHQSRLVIGWGLGSPPLSGPLSKFRLHHREKFIQQFNALITYSQAGAAEYIELGFPEDMIFVAVNAVAPSPTHPISQRPEHPPGGKARVLFVGRLQERKKLDNLILACSKLPPSLQPNLVIVGDGPDRQRLEALAAKIFPSVCFTGALYQEALAQHFREADLFILPGTGGLAVQQAMSFGLPVIVAEADGTQADLVRPDNGWQVPPDDVTTLANALEEALSNLTRLRQMGEKSYQIVKEEINLEQMVAVFVDALNRST